MAYRHIDSQGNEISLPGSSGMVEITSTTFKK